jgi:uncharacterized phiE125 gp8 family phage protein
MGTRIGAGKDSSEPVSLELAKAHCRVDIDTDDVLFESVYIPAARQSAEQYTGLTLTSVQVTDVVDESMCTPQTIPLTQSPVASLDAITAILDDGTRQSLDLVAYGATIITQQMRSIVYTEQVLPEAVSFEVMYTTGYPVGAFPPNLLLAMLMLVGDAYENREAQQSGVTIQGNPRTVALLDPFRLTFGV